MSKERLEDKVVEFRQLLALGHVNMGVLNKAHEIHELVIEQAERVQELEEENKRIRQMKYHEAYEQGKFDTNMKVWYEMPKLEQQNKRYREAQEIIEQVYKESYVRNAYGYEDGFSDGLDTAINIIDEALEESE